MSKDGDLMQTAFPESRIMSEIQAASSNEKPINAAHWYESFARAGLCYGPTFQGLSNITAIGQTSRTHARVGLEPTASVMESESRYILHPATLDAGLQISILAAHKNTATAFRRGFMPTAFEKCESMAESCKTKPFIRRHICQCHTERSQRLVG